MFHFGADIVSLNMSFSMYWKMYIPKMLQVYGTFTSSWLKFMVNIPTIGYNWSILGSLYPVLMDHQYGILHGSFPVSTKPPPSNSVTDKRGGRGMDCDVEPCRCNLAASEMRCASARTSCAASSFCSAYSETVWFLLFFVGVYPGN